MICDWSPRYEAELVLCTSEILAVEDYISSLYTYYTYYIFSFKNLYYNNYLTHFNDFDIIRKVISWSFIEYVKLKSDEIKIPPHNAETRHIWYDMIWYDMIWYDIWNGITYGMTSLAICRGGRKKGTISDSCRNYPVMCPWVQFDEIFSHFLKTFCMRVILKFIVR